MNMFKTGRNTIYLFIIFTFCCFVTPVTSYAQMSKAGAPLTNISQAWDMSKALTNTPPSGLRSLRNGYQGWYGKLMRESNSIKNGFALPKLAGPLTLNIKDLTASGRVFTDAERDSLVKAQSQAYCALYNRNNVILQWNAFKSKTDSVKAAFETFIQSHPDLTIETVSLLEKTDSVMFGYIMDRQNGNTEQILMWSYLLSQLNICVHNPVPPESGDDIPQVQQLRSMLESQEKNYIKRMFNDILDRLTECYCAMPLRLPSK